MLISPKYGMRSDVWLRSWQHSFFALTTWGWRDLDQEEGCLPEGEQQQPQDVKEVWFAGDHSDVGGGHKDAIGLAKISLKWMLNEAASCGLRVEKDQYCKMFKDLSSDQCKRHDQTRKWMWRLLELSPRWDLKNCPLPPRREWTWQPAGPRKISESRRNRDVLHESVKVFYADEEKEHLWGDLKIVFIQTAEHVGTVSGVRCDRYGFAEQLLGEGRREKCGALKRSVSHTVPLGSRETDAAFIYRSPVLPGFG